MDESLKTWLVDHEIDYILHTHKAVFTVPEAKIHCGHIPGTHCKNLFLINKKTGDFYLVSFSHEKRLDLKQFRKLVGAPKIRFASHEDLLEILGITPGAVSPIGLVNDQNNKTVFYVDRDLWNAAEICCHPNVNTETLQLTGENFRNIIKATTNQVEVLKLPYLDDTL